jgi:orotate phosphoribosyltransferase
VAADSGPRADRDASKARLLALLAELSWKRGPVVLASGRTSDFYLDCKQTALHAEGAHVIGQLVFAHVQKLRAAGLRVDGVGGLTLGADPIAVATAVTSFREGAPVHAFIIRKEPKGHGTAAWLEGARNLSDKAPVLMVEDVVTTGGSTQKALDRARESGLTPVGILALVDRQEGGRENLSKTGLPFESLLTRADFDALRP